MYIIKLTFVMFGLIIFYTLCIYQFTMSKDLIWFLLDLLMVVIYSIGFGVTLTSMINEYRKKESK